MQFEKNSPLRPPPPPMDSFIQHGQVLLEVCDNLVPGNLRGYAPDVGQCRGGGQLKYHCSDVV